MLQESALVKPARLMLSDGTMAGPAGGVTLAQLVPTLSSSAMIPAGSFALRLKKTKLAIAEISPPALLVRLAGGALGRPKLDGGGLTHICEMSSFVAPELKV